jgi:hypothetical protein
MEAICSSERSVDFEWTTRRYVPETRTLQMCLMYVETHKCSDRTVDKARTVFALSKAGIVGSDPTQGMDECVCVYSVFR